MSAKDLTRSNTAPFPLSPSSSLRTPPRSPNDPDAVLEALPIGTHDYIRVLGALLRKHNHTHSVRDKVVSTKTMIDRERFLVSFFRELRRDTRYRNLDPRQLAN